MSLLQCLAVDCCSSVAACFIVLQRVVVCCSSCLSTYIMASLHIYRLAKMYRMPYLDRLFSTKELYNLCLFCGKRPAT